MNKQIVDLNVGGYHYRTWQETLARGCNSIFEEVLPIAGFLHDVTYLNAHTTMRNALALVIEVSNGGYLHGCAMDWP